MIVAKAKEVPEEDIWRMGSMDYFQSLAVLEAYNQDLKAAMRG